MRSWSTATSEGTDRVDYWREAICEAIFELDFQSSDRGISAQLNQHDLGIVKLSDVAISSAHTVVRSRQAAARDKSGRFNLNYVREGRWLVNHYGREVEVAAGELILVDNRQPYSVTADVGTVHVCAQLPIDWLRTWLPSPEDAVALSIRPGTPWHGLLTATLGEIVQLRPEETATRSMCVQQIGGALALSLGNFATKPATPSHGLCRRILAHIRERYCEHGLDATTVAAGMQISQRYLHKVLAQAGTTFVRELYAVRLERAQEMLVNPQFASLSVAEIGWRCGFCDPSHFSRKFKAHFDCSPGAFRSGDAEVIAANVH
ncbi:MAG: helix-turn-helix domain-containing protein [Sphingobium sp.]|nr:helix-turn-helix domain-containing protein [Sphingobium sp.]